MASSSSFEFLARTAPPKDGDDVVYANGIFADTGLPLCQLDTAVAAEIATSQRLSKAEELHSRAKFDDSSTPHYGAVGEVDPNNLAEAGWGIVFHASAEDELKKALAPLIERRRQQAGEVFRVFENADGYRPGESCTDWLARHGVGMHVVDPLNGVPFYLLLVGSPEEIPFEFQYLLDIYWGVGRLYFDDVKDYRHYAESVVAYETGKAVQQSKSAAILATSHDGDRATQLFADRVATPLCGEGERRGPLGGRQGFRLQSFIGDCATKDTLNRLLRGDSEGGSPALLFTGSHGMGFRPDDPRIEGEQGALVCQDWEGWGSISASEWYAAGDLPADARMHGLIHFFFACFGAGCPQYDSFVVRRDSGPTQIAPRPLVAKLPQKMLAHPGGGALATIGHVDRAWSTSFSSSKAGPQLQGFRDVMTRLLRGERLGQATDQFDVRRAALSSELADLWQDIEFGKQVAPREIASLWTARNDARNYVILGDPAVRVRVEDLQS